MEMGSESGGSSASYPLNSSAESLNGLKFGKKIYFEDLGVGAPSKSVSGSSNPVRKGRGVGAVQSGQPPRCQVEGCNLDLSDTKAYYSRHKVCGMHSKSATVVVNGIEQRFCQQCSRFHLLPEFDRGKRSCRRRLAGHNERRRKPPPGSLVSSRYGRFSSSVFDTGGSRGGGFLLDFSAYSSHSGRDSWQSTSQNPPSGELLHSSVADNGFSAYSGVADSSCALSLLSNQQWVGGSRNRGSNRHIDVSNMMNPTRPTQSTADVTAVDPFPNTAWDFKLNEGGGSHGMHHGLGLGQSSQQSINNQYPGELQLSQQNRWQYAELDDSTQHMHWSL